MKAQITGLINKYSAYLCVKSKLKANIKTYIECFTVERVCLKKKKQLIINPLPIMPI